MGTPKTLAAVSVNGRGSAGTTRKHLILRKARDAMQSTGSARTVGMVNGGGIDGTGVVV